MSAQAIPEEPKKSFSVIATGLALYSMFFGAGNVVFPLILGRESGSGYSYALLGIGISGVLFPFLGLISMLFCRGDLKAFLGRLGLWPSRICLLVLNVALGLFIVSRLFTLMHASIQIFLPHLSLELFSLFACLLVFFLTFKPHRMVTLLGIVLTPLLLLVLGILVFSGILNAPVTPLIEKTNLEFVGQGLKCGYQMIDLISALLYGTLIIPPLFKEEAKENSSMKDRKIFKKMFQACSISAFLLILTYVGLTWIAAHYGSQIGTAIPSEGLLSALAFKILGPYGGIISSGIIFLACLTTAMSCSSIFANYLRKEICQSKISMPVSLLISLILSAFLATLGFERIMTILTPLIEILYPALIILCLLTIGNHLFQTKLTRAPVYFMLGFAIGILSLV